MTRSMFTESNAFRTSSDTITQRSCVVAAAPSSASIVRWLRLGRNPCEPPRKIVSQNGVRASFRALATTRSIRFLSVNVR
jgi:hypothetical protein